MTDSSICNNSKVFMFLLLGTLSAFGPFITDMFLPTLPSMSDYFQASTSMIQLGLTFSMLGLALGQLVFGPLSDKFGRRPPLIYSMLIFIFSTIGCILSPVIEIFLFFRFLQGIAGAGGVVISRSVAVDKFSTEELTAALSIIGGINGIAPVVAPIIGGFCTDSIGWRGIFLILLILGCLILFMCLNFRESLTEDKRAQDNLWNVFKLFKEVLDNKIYLFYVLQMALSQGILFGNIASSPFIIQEYYQQNALMFSLYFSINSVAIGIGAASSIKFKNPNNGMFVSCIGMLVGSLSSAWALQHGVSICFYETIVTIMCFFMGMTFTVSTAMALEQVREYAGTGSAVLGASGFLLGGLVAPLVGLGNMLVSTSIVFVISAILSTICGVIAFKLNSSAICGIFQKGCSKLT